MPYLVLTLISRFRSSAILLSSYVPTLISCLGFHAILLSHHTLVSCRKILAFLLPFLGMLDLTLLFGCSPLRTFKWSLSDESWSYISTNLAKFLCFFLALGAYNLTNNNKRKWGFNTTFINSCLLANNYDPKKFDLSFSGCGYPNAVKLNRLWQLDLLDPQLVCIIEAILLAVALF